MNTAEKISIQDEILKTILSIKPFDSLEREQISDTIKWVKSGEPIFRISKPDRPKKHLVSYFVVFDEEGQKILLVDHKKAKLWLPTGGHVEIDEHPMDAAKRECLEELGIDAEFWQDDPMFITQTTTVGLTAGHTDVSLWYVIKGKENENYGYDKGEFNGVKWFGFDEIPYENSDQHMRRFVRKLKDML